MDRKAMLAPVLEALSDYEKAGAKERRTRGRILISRLEFFHKKAKPFLSLSQGRWFSKVVMLIRCVLVSSLREPLRAKDWRTLRGSILVLGKPVFGGKDWAALISSFLSEGIPIFILPSSPGPAVKPGR